MTTSTTTRALALLCVVGLGLGACSASGTEVSTSSGGDGTPTTEDESGTGTGTGTGTGVDGTASTTTSTTDADEDEDEPEEEATTTTAPRARVAVEVAESGFSLYAAYDDSQRATAGAVLDNTGTRMATLFEVVFSFEDATGKPVGTETAYVQAIDAGGTAYVEVSEVQLTGTPSTVDVSAVVDDDDPLYESRIVAVAVESVVPDDYGDGMQVNGTAANETDAVIEYARVDCVLRSGGKIVGGASGIMDTIVPGGAVAWEVTGPVRADAAECSSAAGS